MAAAKTVDAVTDLNLSRYMGRWYQIACMPSRFQPSEGVNTRATYTLKDDGTVGVLNETWSDGKRGFIEGSAWKVDPKSPEAKLMVRFWVPPFLPLFPVNGDYWVMDVDKEGYNYALVGQPSRKFLWVLSRTPEMGEELYSALLETAKGQGYDTSLLKKTEHKGEESASVSASDGGAWWLRALFGK